MKKILSVFTALLLAGTIFVSCANDDDDRTVTEYSLEQIYGWTYSCTFTSSSGKSLSPAITIYDDDRLDWNMSTTGMGNNQYVYTAVQTATNNWLTYWYTASTLAEAEALKTAGDTSVASMVVRLGIDSTDQITCLVKSANDGAGDSMGSTPLTMKKESGTKNTTPTTWNETVIKDTLISIPDTAVSAEWPETADTTTYTGSFIYMVKAASMSGEGKTGDSSTPAAKITKTADNTVTVTNVRMYVTNPMEMTLLPFDVTGVAVKKSGDVYYISAGEFTAYTSDYTEDASGNKLTGYKVAGSSLAGKLESGVLTLRLVFRPGSMPLDITEVFTSEN